MNPEEAAVDKYAKAKAGREKHVDAILASPSSKKLVVAGPGTGKTFLFKQILAGKKNTLTLTFINALVDDLALELCGLSDVRTLHGFARGVVSKVSKSVKMYPKLSAVVAEDAKCILGKEIDFDALFHNREDSSEYLPFYKARKDYYGHYGYTDIVFAAVRIFEEKNDSIPTYEQVVVDEFQDFNKLEVSLIEKLAEKSPVLLAGDDDQALYAFKKASADYIRERHGNAKHGYASFNLPYCSRCTRVIVEGVNDVIKAANGGGCLNGRISKPYIYFDDVPKDGDSDANPKIVHCTAFAKMIPWFVQKELSEIAKSVRKKFDVLIISPTRVQSRDIVDGLGRYGMKNIDFVDKRESKAPALLEGLKLLLEDSKCNLGWRISARCLLNDEQFGVLIKACSLKDAAPVCDLVEKSVRKKVKAALALLRKIKDDKQADEAKVMELLKLVDFDPCKTTTALLKDEIGEDAKGGGAASIRQIPVKATTIQSSKGLAADVVFITYFDDLFFIKDKDKTKIFDQDICNLLVALTRARKKVYLVSTNFKKQPTFVKWIAPERLETVVCEKPTGRA